MYEAHMTELLVGRETIADTFHVNVAEVTAWGRQGAPIFRAGRNTCTDLRKLTDWLLEHKRVKPLMSINDASDTAV